MRTRLVPVLAGLLLVPFLTQGSAAADESWFTDVPTTHTFVDEIEWLGGTGISTGYPNSDDASWRFEPSAPVLREQMAAFLYRFASEGVMDWDGASFTDIGPDHVFFDHIEWLAGSGITTGYGTAPHAQFRGSQPVLREQMAAFLHRYVGSPELEDLPTVSPFADVPTTHTFYREIVWLARTGITTGYVEPNGTTTFGPSQPVLREQMAAFLYRLDETNIPPLLLFAGETTEPDVSEDGRFVVFLSKHPAYAEATHTNANGHQQVYLADNFTGALTLVSRSTTGGPANGDAGRPHISDDGRHIAWSSTASDLVPGDVGTQSDAFVFTRSTGAVTMANRTPAGTEPALAVSVKAISPDGSTLGMSMWNPSDTFAMASLQIVASSGGTPVPVPSHQFSEVRLLTRSSMSFSEDGSVMAVSNGSSAWVWHAGDEFSTLIDPRGSSFGDVAITADAGEVLFSSWNRRLVGNDEHSWGMYVYALDVESGALTVVTDGERPIALAANASLQLSRDGRTLLTGGDVLHLLDRNTDTVTTITEGLRGEPLDGAARSASISADGNSVVFHADARGMTPLWSPERFLATYFWVRPDAPSLHAVAPDGEVASTS